MSDASLAMSTALSTEMPTSAARNAGASLIPSPMNPTTCPRRCSAWMIRCLWAGESLAKIVTPSTAALSASSDHPSISGPSMTLSTANPTWRPMVFGHQFVVAGENVDRDVERA